VATHHPTQQQPDLPQPFGYKIAWLALRTVDTQAVVAALRLVGARPANWREGVAHAYGPEVFVTPPLSSWTLAVGAVLFAPDKPAPFVKPFLEHLSGQFGEAQYYCTHRVVELHVWARGVQGRLIRGYGYIGERGETLWDEGEQTEAEGDLGFRFFDERSLDATAEGYWARTDLSFPDEEAVMRLAAAWSLTQVAQLSISCVRSSPMHGILVTAFQNCVKNSPNVLSHRELQSFHYRKPRFSAGKTRVLPISRHKVRNLG
jgi:hypothetical protein